MTKQTLLTGLMLLTTVTSAFAGDYEEPSHHENYWRADCRFHNDEGIQGVRFCYASSIYTVQDMAYDNVFLAVGCDNWIHFNGRARVQMETTQDRISPNLAATPGLEIFPQGQLDSEGTYTSVLDISYGRFVGLCYVHKVNPMESAPVGKIH